MKKTFFLLLILASFFKINAQNKTIPGSFVIKDLEDKSKTEFYTKAIENANFEQYRLQNERVTLEFTNGFKLVLFSAKEIFVNKIGILNGTYNEKYDASYKMPVFTVNNENSISAIYSKANFK